MGSSWGTVIYQIIKADIESFWSEALAEWDDFGATNKDAWRAASPYQATFNDVGEIYFGLSRVIARSLNFLAAVIGARHCGLKRKALQLPRGGRKI